jgi:hypothetical protein
MPKSKKLRSSSTPGRSKGANCQKSVAKTYFCSSRSYKGDSSLYFSGCVEVSHMKGNLPTQEVIRAKEAGII